MDLDFFKDLTNGRNETKDNFAEELHNAVKRNMENARRNELSIIEKAQIDNKFISKYKDKLLSERNSILNNYAKHYKGEMYYVYSKSDTYNLCRCDEGMSHDIIEVEIGNMPISAGVDSILTIEDEKYILDQEATEEIGQELEELVENIIEEQEEYLDKCRVEGHIYEVGEKEADRVWLYDITKNDGEGIEEIEFPKELLNKVEEGDKVEFKDGEYVF